MSRQYGRMPRLHWQWLPVLVVAGMNVWREMGLVGLALSGVMAALLIAWVKFHHRRDR